MQDKNGNPLALGDTVTVTAKVVGRDGDNPRLHYDYASVVKQDAPVAVPPCDQSNMTATEGSWADTVHTKFLELHSDEIVALDDQCEAFARGVAAGDWPETEVDLGNFLCWNTAARGNQPERVRYWLDLVRAERHPVTLGGETGGGAE